MVNMVVNIDGEAFIITSADELVSVQTRLSNKFFSEQNSEEEVIDRYFRETPRLEIYDRVSDYPELVDEIVDRAIEHETDYQTLDEVADALRSMGEALEGIYDYAREWV